jgi:hypothetical protein
MNGYKAFYNGKTIIVYATTSYAAQQKAAIIFKLQPKNEHKVSVVLCELAYTPVVHMPQDLTS